VGRIRVSIHYVGEQQVVGTVKPQGAGSRRVAGAKTFGFPADGLAMQLRRSRTDQEAGRPER